VFDPNITKFILFIIGSILVVIGAFCDLVASIGFLRFPNFFVRLHAATIGAIGGAVVPLIGVAFLALSADFLGTFRWYVAGASVMTAIFILLAAPTGSHALANAAHRAKVVPVMPKVCDHLEEDRGREGEK